MFFCGHVTKGRREIISVGNSLGRMSAPIFDMFVSYITGKRSQCASSFHIGDERRMVVMRYTASAVLH